MTEPLYIDFDSGQLREIEELSFGFRFAAVLCLAASCLPAQDQAPSLSLRDAAGNPASLDQYAGKAIVLNFWATWCGPCAEEMPWLAEVEKTYGDRGVAVIAVSLDDAKSQAKIPRFMQKKKINFPVWLGGTTDDLDRFGLGESLPATAFIDRDGRIVGRVLGMLRKRDLKHRVEWLLGKQQGDPPQPLVNNLGQ
jgi:cytochrome c biogenesis protein CcmG/thiol:disulfide interchange protein DsbE